jgi:deoxyribonuclease V
MIFFQSYFSNMALKESGNKYFILMHERLHSWDVSPGEAIDIQNRLAHGIILSDGFDRITSVAGCDVAYSSSGKACAAVCVFDYPGLTKIYEAITVTDITFPYIPGLLAFREGPALLKAFACLKEKPCLVIFNGQGIAHPRRMGLATHLGMILDVPSIGCAGKNLYGTYNLPGNYKGAYTEITDAGEVIGTCLRTRENVKPVFVSQGYKIDLKTAVEVILHCTKKYRIPEPVRAAHIAAGEARKRIREG